MNAFLSVASKSAALALLIRVTVGFGFVGPPPQSSAETGRSAPVHLVSTSVSAKAVSATAGSSSSAATPPASVASSRNNPQIAALAPARNYMAMLVGFLAAITCTFGNLAAYGQTNIKRLLAYSTIAHAGYMMMPVAAGLVLAGKNPDAAEAAFAAVPLYAGVYLFMNLGAFAIVAFLRNSLRSEEIADYAGLIRSSPGLVICFATILFSLVGLPPLAGFAGKFVIFSALVDGMQSDARGLMIALLVIGGLNTAVSLFYYLRVVKVMTFEPEPKNRVPFSFPLLSFPGAYVVAISLPVLLLGIWWNDLYQWAHRAASQLLW